MKLSKKEVDLLGTLFIMIFFIIVNNNILTPMRDKRLNLENKKNISVSKLNNINKLKNKNSSKKYDAIIELEREISKHANVEQMERKKLLNNKNIETTYIEIKFNGHLESILKVEKYVKKMNEKYSINNIDIKKRPNNIENIEENNNIVECSLEISI